MCKYLLRPSPTTTFYRDAVATLSRIRIAIVHITTIQSRIKSDTVTLLSRCKRDSVTAQKYLQSLLLQDGLR